MGDSSDQSENRLIAERREKLAKLRERGVAFPNDFRRDSIVAELHSAYGEHSPESLEAEMPMVHVAGRLMVKRVMGRASFVKIQDRSGQIQLFVERDRISADVYQDFKSWDVGDIVAATGPLFKTKTGELSVKTDELRLLVKSLRPMPDKWHGISDQELKLRQRYVDLIVNEKTRETFSLRIELIRFIRSFLDALGFSEVETPMMQPIAGGALAKPFVTHHNALDMELYLRVAPELYLKRLLVGGMESVYEINRSFRNEGTSTQHNPEFTMLELYQAYARYEDLMALTQNLIREAARTLLGDVVVQYQGQTFNLGDTFEELSVEEALRRFNSNLGDSELRDIEVLKSACKENDVPVRDEFGAGKLQIELFEKTVEQHLSAPTFVTHYPAEVSPLARCNDADPFVTDRFELFIGGREIANGFSELNDSEDQARRFKAQAEAKSLGDEEAMFYDADYIRALEYGMPPAAGLGIGIDRLVMLLTDSPSIRDVVLFPHLKPES